MGGEVCGGVSVAGAVVELKPVKRAWILMTPVMKVIKYVMEVSNDMNIEVEEANEM